MAKGRQDTSVDRRGFLKSIGGVGVAAATIAAVGVDKVDAAESEAEKRKARYKETDHVKTYYRTNRY